MAASEYGLSIVLDFEDNASAGMKSAESTFSSLSGSADKLTMGVGSTADSLLDLNTSVVGMSVMGSQLQNMGQGLLGVLGSVGGQVIETGSNFESFKLTLDALYGSSEAASGVINDLFKYAVKSPYNVTDLQDMVVTLKSQGLEAFDEMTNASTGFAQSTMDWIGDLQAFRPGVAASRWKLALQNFLSGTDTQSSRVLRNILDVGDLATYVGHDLGTTVTERFQTLMDLVTKMNMAGMQGTLQKTWSVTLANMGDAWEQFAYRLGYGNKSTGLYQSAVQTAQNILSAMTDVFTNDSVIDATSNALKSLVSPLESITSVIAGLAPAFSNWLGQNPQLVSFAAGLTTVSGVALVAGGSLLKLSSGVMNWMLNVQRLGGLTGIFNMLGNSLTALSYRTAGIGSVGLMAYLAWKNNVLGIRDLLTSMGGEIKSVFTTVVQDVSTGNKTITESLNAQGFTPFTQGLSDLREVAGSAGESLYDGFTKVFELFGVNLPKLSSETFSVKEALNDFGESLTERFGDVDQFKEKYGGLISTIGTIGGAFISTLAASTVLSGGIKMLSSSFGALMTNFRVITNTLLSPMGLLGVGVAALTAGYYNNFLGLQDVVTPVVDNIRAKIDQLVTSFSQKDSSGKNSILSAITDKIVSLNETAKTWRSDKLIDNISWRRGVKTTTWLDEGVSIGTLLANGLMSGLMLFGNPIQKALGLGMLAVSHNVGNVQDGLYNIVDDLINTKDLLVEMSTGYGPKSRTLAEQFGLTDFAEGLVNIKDTFKNAGTSFLEGITESNNILGNWVKNTFPDLDFSLTGLLNGIGNLGTSISEKLNTDKGQTFMRNFGQFTSQLSVASAASAVLTGGMGLLFKTFGGLGGVALGLTNALVNPFTLGTVAIMAYQRDFGGIHKKISEFLGRQQDVIDLARSYQGHQYATRFNKDGTESLVNVEAVNAAVDVWERKGELLSSLWDNIKSGAKGAAEEITSVFSALFNTGNQGESTLIEKLGGKVLEFGGFDGIKQKLDSTGQSFGEIATKGALVAGAFAAVSAAGRALGFSLDPVSSGLKLVNQGFNLVKSGASQAVMGVFDNLGNMVRSSSGAFSRTFGVVRDLFIESFSRGGAGGMFSELTSNFSRAMQDAKINFNASMSSLLQDWWNSLGSNLPFLGGQSFGARFRDGIAGALEPIGTFLQGNAMDILGVVAQISTAIQTIRWQTMFGALKSGLSMFGQAFMGASKMVIGLTGMATGFSLLTAAALTFGTLTTSEWDGLSQAMQEQETLVGKVSAGYKWFTNQLSGATAKAVEFISSFDVEGFMGKVTKTIGSLGESIVSIVGGTTGTNGLADLGGRLIDSMFSGVVNNSSKIGSSIQKVFNSVTSAIQTYAPSIGQNLGTLIGKAFQFAGNNAGTFVDTAFTLMESFINGLVANKQQIVNGALQIVDAFVEGVRSHGGNIVNGAMELVSMFVDGLSSRSGAIGEAANTIIQPLMQGIVSNLSKLEGIAKEALGSLMNTIKGVIAEGIANIVNDIGNAALIIAAVMGGIAGVLAFVPGMQVMAAQLGASALQLGALGGGLKVGSNLLDNYSESTLGASSAVNKFNTETSQAKTFVPEVDFSEFQSELNQYDLKKMWANDEIVYTVRTNDDGTTEEVSYKVQRLKDEQGNITYQLVMEESGKSGTEIVDENKSHAESNPATQTISGEDDGSVKSAIDGNKTYAEEHPITQTITYDEQGYDKSVESQDIQQNEQNARNEYASGDTRRTSVMESSSNWEYGFASAGKYAANFRGELLSAQKEFQNLGSWTTEETKQIASLGQQIPSVMNQIYEALSSKPADWIPTAEDLTAWSNLNQLSNIDFSTMFGENGTATISQMTSYLTNLQSILSQFKGSEGVEFTVKFNEDGSVASVEEVKQDVENLDGTSATVDVNEEGAEEAANNVEELNGGMDELNGKNGTATVDESGAEETKDKVEGVNEALDNVDDSKNVEVTTDTDTMSIQELADALSKVNDSYDIKISVIVNGMPEVEKLKSVLDSGSTGGFGFMGVTNSNIAINVTADTTQIDNLKTKVTELGATEATVKVIAEVDSSKVTSLIDTINGVGTKIINVIAVVQGQAQLNTLRDTINSINSKTVTVTANVSGKSEVDALKESIDALQDKTVTVTTVTKEVKEKNAAGTYNFGGGWTYINEQGGELVNLPSGSQIIPHDLSLREQYSKGFETGQKRARADLEQFATLTAPTINMSQLNAPASPISQDSYDYSVNFNEGSIVVKVDNAKGDTDYAAAAEKIWYYIERKQKRDALARRNR